MLRRLFIVSLITLFWSVFPRPTKAQDPPPPPTPSPAVPIDGGLGILIAAGAAFGVKKAWKHRNKA